MNKSPAVLGDDIQRDQERSSKSCTVFAMAVSDQYISTILQVPCH